jgi:hypothetical protein
MVEFLGLPSVEADLGSRETEQPCVRRASTKCARRSIGRRRPPDAVVVSSPIAGRIVWRSQLHTLRARPRTLAGSRTDVGGARGVFRPLGAQCKRPLSRSTLAASRP